MSIGKQLEEILSSSANQVGHWVRCADSIELRVISIDKAVVFLQKNIKQFKGILKGTCCRRLGAISDKDQNLLTVLKKVEELVQYQEMESDESEDDIQDFCHDFELEK